jgi:REP element-mobilizing transposase RayT
MSRRVATSGAASLLGNVEDGRVAFLDVLTSTCERFNWICHAYCLMTNHYHLLMETPDANLSKGMRQLNGAYTQHHISYLTRA